MGEERLRKALEQIASGSIPVEFGPGDVVEWHLDGDVSRYAQMALDGDDRPTLPARPDHEADGG